MANSTRVSLKINPIEGDDNKGLKINAELIYADLKLRANSIQDENDRKFYIVRVRAYLKDFPMLNHSSDLDDLHTLAMELILQNRLALSGNYGDLYNDSVKRANQIKESFSVRRVDRKKMPEKQEDFIRVISEVFSSNEISLEEKDREMKKEEEEFLQEKKERDLSLGLVDGSSNVE